MNPDGFLRFKDDVIDVNRNDLVVSAGANPRIDAAGEIRQYIMNLWMNSFDPPE